MAEQVVGRASVRSRGVAMDMVRSMGLVAVVLLAWLWIAHPRTPEGIRTVEWQPVAHAVAAVAAYEVLAPPEALGWPATSARVEPQPDGTVIWRVGFLDPEQDYAALLQRGVLPEQSVGTARDWVAQETRQGEAAGTVEIGGQTWTRLEAAPAPDERRSLVMDQAGTVTVVTGSAGWNELEHLAGSLRPVTQG